MVAAAKPPTEPEARPRGAEVWARLTKTRAQFARGLHDFFSGDAAAADRLDELHEHLILADVGVTASARIIQQLRQTARRATTHAALTEALRRLLTEILLPCEQPLKVSAAPFVIMVAGVNGVGKTTTVAKLAAHFQRAGRAVLLAACDTFRAAAIPQLQAWGARLRAPVIARSPGADAAAVAHDAYRAACARGAEVLLIDTAGRQHTSPDLMRELQKMRRVLGGIHAEIPHEVLLVVDAGCGHNAISQTAQFQRDAGARGLCVTKLDGTAKGGMVIALAEQFGLPIRYIGVGEAAEDLRIFRAAEFAAALLPAAAPTAREK